MATPVIMPKQGQSVESCIITKWYKKKGDTVNVGDILFNYETDKASFDEESKVSGILLEIFFNEGDDVPVFTNVCVIGNSGENIDEFIPGKANSTGPVKADDPLTEEQSSIKSFEITKNNNDKIFISPRAKKYAEKIGIDYNIAKPTGPGGRIIEEDIIALQQDGKILTSGAKVNLTEKDIHGTGLGGRITLNDIKSGVGISINSDNKITSDYMEVKHSNIRKVIAKAMYNSLSTTAQLTLHSSFDATSIIGYRKKLKESKDSQENITINDIILYAVSRTLLNHKSLNANYFDDKMLVFNNTHLGIAIDTDRGLMVPTLFNANKKSLNEIAAESKALAKKCQDGTIVPDELKGASFTITNLGTLGIEMFTPILNPPQVGILGVNTIVQRAKDIEGEIKFYPSIGLSLTFDHRAIDGAPAARFLHELVTNLENFNELILL